jgi:hypothetical protein
MIEPRRAGPPALLVLLALAVLGCAGVAGGASPSAEAASSAPAASEDAVAPEGGPPTACLTLADVECLRARELALTALDLTNPAPTYIQVGPFGCAAGDRCPATLAARPEGDVVIEFGGGEGVNVHLVVAGDGSFDATRDVPMGVAVEPSSAAGLPSGPLDMALGHCGIFSGIDVGGSWWDPVGQVSMDTGDAVNATPGVFTLLSEDSATFVAPSGFAVQLVRRDGPKLLPMCM